MLVALELVALKVDLETRRRVKILAAERGLEMWELVHDLIDAEWLKRQSQQPPSDRQAGQEN